MTKSCLWMVAVTLAFSVVDRSLAVQSGEAATRPATLPAADARPTVTLLEAGAQPRRELRVRPVAGSSQRAKLTMRVSNEQSLGDMKMPRQEMPVMYFVMELAVKDVQPNGDFAYDFQYVDAGVELGGANPQLGNVMQPTLKSMIGLSGRASFTSTGMVKEATLEAPDDANHMVKQQVEGMKHSLHQVSAPFPQEAVGVGGKWRVSMPIVTNGISLQQTVVYTLRSIEGDSITIDAGVKQHADEQDVNPVGAPRGLLRLNSLDSTGEGWLTLDLTRCFPIRSMIKMTTDTDMMLKQGPENMRSMQQHMEITIRMEEAKIEGADSTGEAPTRPAASEP